MPLTKHQEIINETRKQTILDAISFLNKGKDLDGFPVYAIEEAKRNLSRRKVNIKKRKKRNNELSFR